MKKKFAVMYDSGDGKTIKVFDKSAEARKLVDNVACMGYAVTMFVYDLETLAYEELYSI